MVAPGSPRGRGGPAMKRYLILLHSVCWATIAAIVAAQIWGPLPFWPALLAAIAVRMVDIEHTMVIKSEMEETPS